MFENYELLLKFFGEIKGTCGHSDRTKTIVVASFTLYLYVCTNAGLDCSLSKCAFDIQEIVAPMSNREMVLFSLIVTGKFAAYFMLLNLTSIISSACCSHSESDEE